jgi:hypothetical protein
LRTYGNYSVIFYTESVDFMRRERIVHSKLFALLNTNSPCKTGVRQFFMAAFSKNSEERTRRLQPKSDDSFDVLLFAAASK